MSGQREKFEAWLNHPRACGRFSIREEVQLQWEAWQTATESAQAELAAEKANGAVSATPEFVAKAVARRKRTVSAAGEMEAVFQVLAAWEKLSPEAKRFVRRKIEA